MLKTILHCDANNFFASVECALNPNYVGLPIAVSGNPEKRHGIILAKSTLAKNAGVATGETIWQAQKKCPQLILVPPHYDEYVEFSQKLFDIYTQYTDRVEPFGIDECWLDCTNTIHLFGDGKTVADELREKIKKELNLTISAGVSFTKIFAKLGSDMKKPDATTVITPQNYQSSVWRLAVSDLMMVGGKTTKLLRTLGIYTIGDLATAEDKLLSYNLGINGKKLKDYANGRDNEEIRLYYDHRIPESIGNSTTTPLDITSLSQAKAVIVGLSEMVATRLRKHNLSASGVHLGIKYNDLTHHGKQISLPQRTNNAKELVTRSLEILHSIYNFESDLPLRAISVSTFKLTSADDNYQRSIFDTDQSKADNLEVSVDTIRNKYGYSSLKKGIMIAHSDYVSSLEVTDFQPFKK